MLYTKAVEEFIRYLESIDRAGETIRAYGNELRYFGKYLNKKNPNKRDIEDIDIGDLEDYLYKLKLEEKTSATRSRVVYIFRSFYNYLYKRDLCPKNLAILLESIKVKQVERTYISDHEFILLSNKIENKIIKASVETMFYTGLRVSEVINLNLDTVDLNQRIIYVKSGKGNKDRKVPICEKLYNILMVYLEEIRPDIYSERFFCTEKTGKLSSQYINRTLHKVEEELKWNKSISAHILRHSFASNLIKQNAPLPSVQRLLGHSDLRTTSRYIHQDFKQLIDAVNLL